ncbi:hypothetical protein EVAR_39846_1 [Eumeta japonica]|uniref:Uncharacterized protein n=1 Tax=Eumeta variegata TaxID=151549 RepID=A0A4C1WSZ5_EUMVA|nr:hypothetical protein EVAR_39846_1 [Eumeta japonica]
MSGVRSPLTRISRPGGAQCAYTTHHSRGRHAIVEGIESMIKTRRESAGRRRRPGSPRSLRRETFVAELITESRISQIRLRRVRRRAPRQSYNEFREWPPTPDFLFIKG